MSESVLIALVTGAASGLITWGAIRVELAWLRRDVDELRDLAGLARSRGKA